MFGYMGSVLRVNLTKQRFFTEELRKDLPRKFVGGNGFGVTFLFKEVGRDINPLASDNKLIFATGPLTGTPIPVAVEFGVFAKSPLTNHLGESYSSGFFGPQLKRSGYDVLIIEGRASKPVYLRIMDRDIRLEGAEDLWGRDCWETEEILRKEEASKDSGVLTIGPAGENMVRFACVTSDFYRQAGRTGLGAVMGSKQLKAIVVKGSKEVEVAKPLELEDFVKEWTQKVLKSPKMKGLRAYGTPSLVILENELGVMPTRNWQESLFEHAEEICGEALRKLYVTRTVGCLDTCPIACGKHSVVREGRYKGSEVVGPENQTIYALGHNCGIGDLGAIIKANELCDRLGLDTMSTGCTLAFAMECYERGKLTKADLDGVDLRFGNDEALIEMVRKIAYREGFGNLLAEGVRILATKLGAEDYAIQIKGLEPSGFDLRGLKGAALAYAVSNRGGCHLRGRVEFMELLGLVDRFNVESKARLVKEREDLFTVLDSLIVCKFAEPVFDLSHLANTYSLVTGEDLTEKELLQAGERTVNLERMFISREGLSRKDDTLPERIMSEPIAQGPSKGQKITSKELKRMLDQYYMIRGWDRQTGKPAEEKLIELNLEEYVNEES
ncbi:MAG: aldehyde ferredoxin oxidoreductase family protein [Candidatus Bathyarchaeota archaeon]|nr:aldehyde ferredoxin oxidoreductase family protein [Candidatus Bathyarchaeota archaeon]